MIEAQAAVLGGRALLRQRVLERKPKLGERIKRRVGGWMVRRLQKRVEREWREYEHSPKVTLGPWSRRRSGQGGTQVYRSLVQIHFHPRERGPRQ